MLLSADEMPVAPVGRATSDLLDIWGLTESTLNQTLKSRPTNKSSSQHTRSTTHTSRSSNEAGPSRPRGTASQESSWARRASKAAKNAPEPIQDDPGRFPPAMRQAFNRARTRHRLRLKIERKRCANSDTTSNYTYHLPPELIEIRQPSSPDLMEDNEEERVAAEAESHNRDPKSKRQPKPAARDVHGNERHALTVAKPHLFVYSAVEGAWQMRGLITSWAHAIYRLTWEEEYPGLAYEAPSHRTIQCMVNSQPAFRGKSKDGLRPFTEFYWGFKNPASTPTAIAHNIALVQKLAPNMFHCLAYDPPYGHYEGEALKMAIAIVFFTNPTAVGVSFRNYLDPLPETAVAYVLANMQFCIEEYSSGKFQPRELNAADMLNKYVAHLRGLKRARRKARVRFERLAREWFDFGYDYSGATELEDPFTQPLISEADIRPDTPTLDETSEQDYLREPEDEVQPELDEEGRYSKRAKGKGRA
ncbi:hypothetical protein RhiJN_17059 [Ceratobasidium sp. AG-Ba]|nr:hypothetical protein RhiJN_17059 [Ceratobasidium sp. AG-Ba]